MDDAELARCADANYWETWRQVVEVAPGGLAEEADGLVLTATRIPIAFFNAAFITSPPTDPADTLVTIQRFYDRGGVPFTVRAPLAWATAIGPAADAAGLTRGADQPGMALWPIPDAPLPPMGLVVRAADSLETLDVHVRVAAAGFGMPYDVLSSFVGQGLLDRGRFQLLIGEVDGSPVCTSAWCVTGDTVGVYNVATIESHRQRGLGEAMTWAAVHRGREAGGEVVTVSILQASAMGRPIYERMGYRLVSPYAQWEGEPAGR